MYVIVTTNDEVADATEKHHNCGAAVEPESGELSIFDPEGVIECVYVKPEWTSFTVVAES